MDHLPIEGTTHTPHGQTTHLDPDTILAAEFDYIEQTAHQAHEDRARVTSYYLVTVGSLVAAILSAQVEKMQIQPIYLAFSGLFFLLSMDGLLTLMQLARLRQAWYDSARAMALIKDFYIRQYPSLEDAFRWKTKTVPACYKPWSVSFLLALQVSSLSSGVVFAAVAFAGQGLNFNWAVVALLCCRRLFCS